MDAVLPHLDELGLDPTSVTRNRFILDRMLGFINATLGRGSYTQDDLTALGRELAPATAREREHSGKSADRHDEAGGR
jgi:hypothetical protein